MRQTPPPPDKRWRYRVECALRTSGSRWVVCPEQIERADVYAAAFAHARKLKAYSPLKIRLLPPDDNPAECAEVVLDLDEPDYEAIGDRLWRRYKAALDEASTVRAAARALVEPDEIADANRHVQAVEKAAQVYLDGHLARQILRGLFLPPTPATPRAGYLRDLRAALVLEQETQA